MDKLPTETPETIPEAPTVASSVLLLVHVPPVVVLPSAVFSPMQTVAVPVIAAGKGLTVTAIVLKQPFGPVYVIMELPPMLPVTVPAAFTVATLGLLLLHVPPVVASPNEVVAPAHNTEVPVTSAGSVFTVAST